MVVEANPSLLQVGSSGNAPCRGSKEESKYCFAWGLDSRSLQDQVVLAHNRWVIERFYQDAKGELGLDDYEGRFWTGLHRHVALVMMAHSFLSIRRNHGLPPQTDSTDGPRQFPSATSVAGFPPKGRQSLAALRRSIHEEFFIQVIEAAIRTRDGP